MTQFRVTKTARKHKAGNARIVFVMANAHTVTTEGDQVVFTGEDKAGIEWTIIIVPDDRAAWADCWAVIHAMPTSF